MNVKDVILITCAKPGSEGKQAWLNAWISTNGAAD